jgi:hypothetical protein
MHEHVQYTALIPTHGTAVVLRRCGAAVAEVC